MLMLLFYAGDERYAISANTVVEVVPLVTLKKAYHAPDYVAGLFNYRGQVVPVIDVCHLIQGHACRPHLSTRIILINSLGYESNRASLEKSPIRLLGLMAERVTETINQRENDLVYPTIRVDKSPYLGGIITDDRGMIQSLNIEQLFPNEQDLYLLPKQET